MADHRLMIPIIKKWEGGLSRDATDYASSDTSRPGPYHTNQGITWTTWRTLAPRYGLVAPGTSVQSLYQRFVYLTPADWEAIYKRGYWDAVQGDRIKSQAVADLLVDYTWGSGPGNSVRAVQRALNAIGIPVAVDGGFGPKTLAAINSAPETGLLEALNNERKNFLRAIIARDPAQAKFQTGWDRRVNAVFEFAKKTLAPSQP